MQSSRAKNVIRFMLPTMLSNVCFFLFTIVDGVFVGNGVGTNGLGAVNIAMPFTMVTGALFMMINIGSATMVAVRMGRNDTEGANKVFRNGMILLAGVAAVLCALGVLCTDTICRLLGANETFHEMAADYLFWYDNEIIAIIASQQGFDENYVSRMSEKSIQQAYPMTIGHRFRTTGPNYATQQAIKIHVEQQRMIEGFAAQGDCIIIGRCADVILRNYKPFHIFVYADMATKLQRCIERAPEDENLSQVELERKIRGIDKNRANHRSIYTDTKWGAKENYHLCVNTTGIDIKTIVPPLAEYMKLWFANAENR